MKIPDKAKKVFNGVIFDVYHWQQEMFDGSFETFEMLKRADTLQIIATLGDKIIIAKEEQPTKKPTYTLIGGRKEENEEHLVGAKRELLEESGLVSDDWELIKSYNPYFKMEWAVYLYVARNCKKIAEQSLDPGEKIELIEVDIDEFIDKIITGDFWGKEIACDVMKMKLDGKLDEFKKQIFGK